MADIADWLHSSFNIYIPVTINNWKYKQQRGQRVILQLPLPYHIGESFYPGNGDEKIYYKAGTYAWLQDNCPNIPILRLYGFALSTGQTV